MKLTDLILDTNVLWKHSLRNQLTNKVRGNTLRVYIPTLIQAERIRQIADNKGESFAIHVIQQLTEDSGFELLPFTLQDAEAIAEVWLNLKANGASNQDWEKHRFDILLCAVAHSRGYTLVTDDTGDHFKAVPAKINTSALKKQLKQM